MILASYFAMQFLHPNVEQLSLNDSAVEPIYFYCVKKWRKVHNRKKVLFRLKAYYWKGAIQTICDSLDRVVFKVSHSFFLLLNNDLMLLVARLFVCEHWLLKTLFISFHILKPINSLKIKKSMGGGRGAAQWSFSLQKTKQI